MPTTRTTPSLLLALLLPAISISPGAAEIPDYEPADLRARSAFAGAWNLPDSSFFTNSTIALNDAHQVAIKLSVLGSGQGIFLDDGTTAGVAYAAPTDASLSDVDLNDLGTSVFPQTFSAENGIWQDDAGPDPAALRTNLPLGSTSWGTPQIDDAGVIGWRAGFSGSGQAFVSLAPGRGDLSYHALEVGLDPMSPYSFLFTPSSASGPRIAGKVRLGTAGQTGGSQPDQIRLFEADGSSTLIAEDEDSDVASIFQGFDNGVTLTEAGTVAFVSTLTTGIRGVYLSDGATLVEIALESDPEVSEIEFFAPEANSAGLVAFRGRDASGLQAIFVGDGIDLVRLVGEHDLVETDLGTARLDQHDSSPIFGGGIAINELGSVAFAAGVTPPDNDQIEWGSGLFVLEVSTEIFADGFESGDTTAWMP